MEKILQFDATEEEKDVVRSVARAKKKVIKINEQITSDRSIIDTVHAKIEGASDATTITDEELRNLLDARTRTRHNIKSKKAIKEDLPKLRELISNSEFKAEIDAEVAKL